MNLEWSKVPQPAGSAAVAWWAASELGGYYVVAIDADWGATLAYPAGLNRPPALMPFFGAAKRRAQAVEDAAVFGAKAGARKAVDS